MTKNEALNLALEALENELAVDMTNSAEVGEAAEQMCDAIAAIKEALAQPEPLALAQASQEPVLWMMPDGKTADKWALQFYGGQKGKPLYTSPPQRQPLTEEQARNLLRIGPVHAPDGVVTRTPLAYRKELLETALWALRKGEAAHGIGDKT